MLNYIFEMYVCVCAQKSQIFFVIFVCVCVCVCVCVYVCMCVCVQDDKLSCPPLSMASSVPSAGSHSQPGAATSIPITIPEGQIKRSLSWQIPNASPGLLVRDLG